MFHIYSDFLLICEGRINFPFWRVKYWNSREFKRYIGNAEICLEMSEFEFEVFEKMCQNKNINFEQEFQLNLYFRKNMAV